MAEILPQISPSTPEVKENIATDSSDGNTKKKPLKEEKEVDLSHTVLEKDVMNPIWLSVSEAAKLGGVQNKTIRRALQAKTIKYKIVSNRYLIDLASVVKYLHTSRKLHNKLKQNGLGQYIDNWRK